MGRVNGFLENNPDFGKNVVAAFVGSTLALALVSSISMLAAKGAKDKLLSDMADSFAGDDLADDLFGAEVDYFDSANINADFEPDLVQ